MKRYVVVSTTNNPDYYFYATYIEKAWNSLGWDLCVMITEGVNPLDLKLSNRSSVIVQLPKIEGLRDATIAQAGRLYAANYLPEDAMIMTSDIDLLPLSDYWNPSADNITVYGHDLTWYSYYPMGYVAMTGKNWKQYLSCTMNTAIDLERDAKLTGIAYSEDWEQWWNHDWQHLTNVLKQHTDKITFINRGQVQIAGATLALGRIDRYDWEKTQEQSILIDAHCENNNVLHPDKLNKFLKVFEKFYGNSYSQLNGI